MRSGALAVLVAATTVGCGSHSTAGRPIVPPGLPATNQAAGDAAIAKVFATYGHCEPTAGRSSASVTARSGDVFDVILGNGDAYRVFPVAGAVPVSAATDQRLVVKGCAH
jgi:hypothetical protein